MSSDPGPTTGVNGPNRASVSRLSILREPAFLRFYISRAASQFGNAVAPVALSLTVLGSFHAVALGLLLASQVLPQLLLTLVGGVVGDRFERRRLLVATNLTMAVAQAATALLLICNLSSLALLILLQAIYGAARAFSAPSGAGIVRELVGRQQLREATSLLNVTRDTLMIVGPIIGGLIVIVAGGGYALMLDAATFVVSAMFIRKLPITKRLSGKDKGFLSELRAGWTALIERPWAYSMIASFSFYQAAVLPCALVLGPMIAISPVGIGASGWSAVLSAQGVGAVIGGLLVLRWNPRRPLVVAAALVVGQSFFLAALGTSSSLWVLMSAGAIATGGVIAADTLWTSTLQRKVPENLVSRLTSYDYLGSLAFFPLGIALLPLLAELLGPTSVMLAVAAANVLVCLALLLVPSVRAITSDISD